MEILGSKWKLPIIWYLAAAEDKTLRYNELQRRVKGVTTTMLSKCLKELERDKIISRRQYNTIPPTVEYSLTPAGMPLLPAALLKSAQTIVATCCYQRSNAVAAN